MRLFLLLLAATSHTGAWADWSADRVPTGKSWFCFESESFGQCRRLREECIDFRRQYQDKHADEEVGACREQKKAAMITFREVLKDRQRFVATPTFEGCKTARAGFVAAGEDYSQLSKCVAVGERRAKFHNRAPRGPYYCSATVFMQKGIGGLYGETCSTTMQECFDGLEEERKQSPADDPLEVLLNCERRDLVYATPALGKPKEIVIRPNWCESCEVVW